MMAATSDSLYVGDVLEDLKQMGYLLGALSRNEQHPDTKRDFQRFAEAANHALQILDKNRDVVSEYECKTRTGRYIFHGAFLADAAVAPIDLAADTALAEAIAYLNAQEVAPGRYACKSKIDYCWYVTSERGLLDIYKPRANETFREKTPPTKMPAWWTPEQRFAWRIEGCCQDYDLFSTHDAAEAHMEWHHRNNERVGSPQRITADLETGEEIAC